VLPHRFTKHRKQRPSPKLIAIPGDPVPWVLVLILPNLIAVHIAGLNRRGPVLPPRLYRPAEIHLAILLNIRLVDAVILDIDAVTRTLRPVTPPIGLRQRNQ
jgi:hypothetical protein